MKHVMLIGDGMGDYPRPELGGLTPLAAARTPNMDKLAHDSLIGHSQTVPRGMDPGSDVANMALMGYDPAVYLTGRAPLEAASLNIPLDPDDVAFRCNLVVLYQDVSGAQTMVDYCSGHIPNKAARPIVAQLQAALGDGKFVFHQGTSYRHVLVWKGGRADLTLAPPHDHSGQEVTHLLAALKEDCPELYDLTRRSWGVLSAHSPDQPIRVRPTSIWLWGQGKPPSMAPFKERYGKTGAVISAVDLLKGMGAYAGLEVIEVPGASGWLDTNYSGKVRAGLEALRKHDFLYLHVEAPDEAGHSGVLKNKLQAIEDFDAHVVGPLLAGLDKLGPYRLALACDHYTPLEIMTHSSEPVPVMIHERWKKLSGAKTYTEQEGLNGPDFGPAHGLMDRLFGDLED